MKQYLPVEKPCLKTLQIEAELNGWVEQRQKCDVGRAVCLSNGDDRQTEPIT